VAPLVPAAVTPNVITLVSTAMLLPVLFLLSRQYFVLSAVLVFVHDMADRLDGSVARARVGKRGVPAHDGRFGAFLDAQGDKIFHVGFLVGNLVMSSTSWVYKVLALAVILTQSVSFVVRCLDYFLPANNGGEADLKAGGEGKLATTFCNAAALAACLAGRGQVRRGNCCCCLLFVVCFVVCCLLFVVCCLLFVVLLFVVCCLLFVVCCLLFVVCCLLFVVCCFDLAKGLWSALASLLLLLSLDLALRSVKRKLVARVSPTNKGPESSVSDSVVFFGLPLVLILCSGRAVCCCKNFVGIASILVVFLVGERFSEEAATSWNGFVFGNAHCAGVSIAGFPGVFCSILFFFSKEGERVL
jgi:phosphatidylglycerophosphate synthase